MAEAECGTEDVRAASLASSRELKTDMTMLNVWGIKIAEPNPIDFVRQPVERGYSPLTTPTRIDEAAEGFERLMTTILEMASAYVKIKKMGEDIKKTTRRVNALEQNVVPRLRREVAFIRSTLEEREREDVFRMKRMKGDDTDPIAPGIQKENDPFVLEEHEK